jgi:ribonuclease E
MPEPASEESVTEGVTGPGEEMENAQQPAEFPGEGLIETPAPAPLNEDAPPASQRQPLFPEEAELPLEPASVEEPPSPAETMEENGSGTNETLESPQQEPVDVQPPADETAPAESAAEADEIPTAGSPELQRVLENIDRTFNN